VRAWALLRSLLLGWLLSFAAFGLLAFVQVGQFSLTWPEAEKMAERDWLPWALFAPLIFQLTAWLPLDRPRWKLSLPVHLAAGYAALVLCNFWTDYLGPVRTWHGGATHPWHFPSENHGPTAGGVPHGPWHPPERRSPFQINWFGFRFPIYLALVSMAHALYYSRRSKERELRSLELEARLAQARLEALKMQLQPHFLFNALNAIAALVHKDAEAADEMLAALSDFLRMVLETTGAQELPLSRELALVERYLAIEHARFGDRLRYVLDVPSETEPALVPAFLLQPLVENAVRHGLEPRPGAGSLSIRARRKEGLLHLSVADDGVGLTPGKPTREGIGLENTRARLHELYQGAATLELRNGSGVTVEITLPFHEAA
jgi:two-component sensor histidine kinase